MTNSSVDEACWPPPRAAQNYLDRIDYKGSRKLEYPTLKALQRAHMTHVPFENLSISLAEPIVIDLPLLYDKIVTRKRGGFCYELNGLFGWLLGKLGFEVQMLSARVCIGPDQLSPEFSHMLLAVGPGPDWIVDVGFGDCFVEPLPFKAGTWAQCGWFYRLTQQDGDWRLSRRRGDDPWQDQYVFTAIPRSFADYAEMCNFQQTSPLSHFTRNTICSRVHDSGRITLSKIRLSFKGAQDVDQDLEDAQAYGQMLQRHFGIELEAASLTRLHQKILNQMGEN